MFIFSVRASKIKIFAVAGIVIAVIFIGGSLISLAKNIDVEPVAKNLPKLLADTNETRIEFLESFGWAVKEEAVEIIEIIIPVEFDEIYNEYNDIQKKQGFNLELYRGERVKKWSYEIINYPDMPINMRANILVSDGKIIGGDICSIELNGFTHGFKLPV